MPTSLKVIDGKARNQENHCFLGGACVGEGCTTRRSTIGLLAENPYEFCYLSELLSQSDPGDGAW